MRFAPFTLADVRAALDASEGQPGPDGRGVGHARARHVHISRAGLFDRMYTGGATNAGMPVYTAFLRRADQDAAVCEVLNSAIAAAPLNAFYAPSTPDNAPCVLIDVPLRQAVEVRVAIGGNGPATRMASFMAVKLRRMRGRPRDLHVVTAFATFEPLSLGDLPDGA